LFSGTYICALDWVGSNSRKKNSFFKEKLKYPLLMVNMNTKNLKTD